MNRNRNNVSFFRILRKTPMLYTSSEAKSYKFVNKVSISLNVRLELGNFLEILEKLCCFVVSVVSQYLEVNVTVLNYYRYL